jgi:hypothetical protein
LGTSSSPPETTAWAADSADITLFNDTTAGIQDGQYSWGQEPLPYTDPSLADKDSTWLASQYVAEQEMPQYMGSSSPKPNPWNRRPEPQTFLPFHKWGLQDGFMAIFEAGEDFTGFSSFRVPLLMSASSRKAAFELIDDQIQDIRKIVFCLERIQPWMLNKITSYLDSTITTRTCILIDRLMEHITLVLEQPLLPKDGTDDFGKLWPSLGILLDEESTFDLKLAEQGIIHRQGRWNYVQDLIRKFSKLDKTQTTSLTPIHAKLANLDAKMVGHFVSGLHPLLPMIGVTCASLLFSSDGPASDEKESFRQAAGSFMRGDIDWLTQYILYVETGLLLRYNLKTTMETISD